MPPLKAIGKTVRCQKFLCSCGLLPFHWYVLPERRHVVLLARTRSRCTGTFSAKQIQLETNIDNKEPKCNSYSEQYLIMSIYKANIQLPLSFHEKELMFQHYCSSSKGQGQRRYAESSVEQSSQAILKVIPHHCPLTSIPNMIWPIFWPFSEKKLFQERK